MNPKKIANLIAEDPDVICEDHCTACGGWDKEQGGSGHKGMCPVGAKGSRIKPSSEFKGFFFDKATGERKVPDDPRPYTGSGKYVKVNDAKQVVKLSKRTHWDTQRMEYANKYLKNGPIEFVLDKNGKAILARSPESAGYPNWRDTHDNEVSQDDANIAESRRRINEAVAPSGVSWYIYWINKNTPAVARKVDADWGHSGDDEVPVVIIGLNGAKDGEEFNSTISIVGDNQSDVEYHDAYGVLSDSEQWNLFLTIWKLDPTTGAVYNRAMRALGDPAAADYEVAGMGKTDVTSELPGITEY